MKGLILCSLGSFSPIAAQKPIRFESQADFDFPLTTTEVEQGWDFSKRCGQAATAGQGKDQREDTNCPNVLLINTDDMSWADVSINNPSKAVPTPNIDRLVSKGINFRDGHSCTARCAPSRYCLMTGRYHFRRGHYHYKPMELEYGRKVLSHIFKRNNYYTMTVGKPQPVEDKVKDAGGKNFYFLEGTRFWGFDESFSSRSYCCLPGGGYFKNDQALTPFDRYSVFMNFRLEDESSVQIKPVDEDKFWKDPDHWHLLDGYTVDGNPKSKPRPNSYMAYWNMIKKNQSSGLNRRRRRRNVDGLRIMRHHQSKIRRRKRNANDEYYINESVPAKGESYVRFQNQFGQVLVAEHRLRNSRPTQDRMNYEFAVNKLSFPTFEIAEKYKNDQVIKCRRNNQPEEFCKGLEMSKPALTQIDYDSRLVMKTFKEQAMNMITKHVEKSNPIMQNGAKRNKNQNRPFFMYLSWRAPHRPMSHDWEFDQKKPWDHMPYVAQGKPGEQLGIFDEYIGQIMKRLQDLKVADNTFIVFTSDNGPDQGGLNLLNKMGHLRMVTMRGRKASVYEGGHRVPFLTWWPKGIDRALHGSNYDLPVSQTDLFATFADIMKYPLPGGDKCTYGFDSTTAHHHQRDPTIIGRKTSQNCLEVRPTYATTTTATTTTRRTPAPTSAANPLTPTVTVDTSGVPTGKGSDWSSKNAAKCKARHNAGTECSWNTCNECKAFWELHQGSRNARWLANRQRAFCKANQKCYDWVAPEPTEPPEVLMEGPGSLWTNDVKNKKKCHGNSNAGDNDCDWNTCVECKDFWTLHQGKRGNQWLNRRISKFCVKNESCFAQDMARGLSPCRYNARAFDYVKDINKYGYSKVETFNTQEDLTGYLVGWEGCMAEDSHSFYQAFTAVKNKAKSTSTHDHFDSALERTESKFFAGKLGDLTLRVGRYKLIRFNAPKDKRTGPTRQHLTDHHGKLWLAAQEKDQCVYDVFGISQNDRCKVEPDCRDHTTWGETFCMRDHYYQLFDLERNFGEKTMCNDEGPRAKNPNLELEAAMLGKELARKTTDASKASEKPTDPYGITLGVELTPVGNSVNDCCLLNYDEKKKWLQNAPDSRDPCESIKIKSSDGKVRNGGSCRPFKLTGHFKNADGTLASFLNAAKKYENSRSKSNGWSADIFEGFDKFEDVNAEDFTFGYGCSAVIESRRGRETYVMGKNGDFREASLGDKFCQPPKEFKLGCKVPDHNGALAEGWETNTQWAESKNENRRPEEGAQNGDLAKRDFGIWTKFGNCMAAVMKLMEGAAYKPEVNLAVDVNKRAHNDVGTKRGQQSGRKDHVLAGSRIGSSKMHKEYLATLWEKVAPGESMANVGHHGGGTRFWKNKNLAEKCLEFLPEDEPKAFVIQPNFDMDMSLMGWYDTGDQSGGQNTKLKKKPNGTYEDDRKVHKYYEQKNGQWLFAFKPEYITKKEI